VNIAQCFATAELEDLDTVPLHRLLSWERGHRPVVSETLYHQPVWLTMDCHGMKSVDRPSSQNLCAGYKERYGDLAFAIIEDSETHAKLAVNFKVNQPHLTTPGLEILPMSSNPKVDWTPLTLTFSTAWHV